MGFLPVADVTEMADLWASVFSTPHTSKHYHFFPTICLAWFCFWHYCCLTVHIMCPSKEDLPWISLCQTCLSVSYISLQKQATMQAFWLYLVWYRWVIALFGIWWTAVKHERLVHICKSQVLLIVGAVCTCCIEFTIIFLWVSCPSQYYQCFVCFSVTEHLILQDIWGYTGKAKIWKLRPIILFLQKVRIFFF